MLVSVASSTTTKASRNVRNNDDNIFIHLNHVHKYCKVSSKMTSSSAAATTTSGDVTNSGSTTWDFSHNNGDDVVGVVVGRRNNRWKMIKPSFSSCCSSLAPILLNILCFIGLICYHVHAESTTTTTTTNHSKNTMDETTTTTTTTTSTPSATTPNLTLWERIVSGPSNLTTMDKILFGVLVLLGMELLNYISSNLGRKFFFLFLIFFAKFVVVLSR